LLKGTNLELIVLRVGVLFSGGKDSAYSAYIASQRDTLTCLVTLRPRREDSYMFHFPNLRWTALQAESMSLPQVNFDTEGQKEVELDDMRSALKAAKEEYYIEGVYTGALASVYQKSRVDRICDELGLKGVSPMWGIDPRTHLLNLIGAGFEVVITGVAAMGLDETWLGRKLDGRMVDELTELQKRYGLHAALEGGEGETFVLDCPLFEKKVEILSSKKHWNGVNGHLEFLDARLAAK
jgi:ABC transporter with metal-binding/Fe-S-binding domain ATP-binding protein